MSNSTHYYIRGNSFDKYLSGERKFIPLLQLESVGDFVELVECENLTSRKLKVLITDIEYIGVEKIASIEVLSGENI